MSFGPYLQAPLWSFTWAAGGQPVPPLSSTRATGQLLLQTLSISFHSFFTEICVCRVATFYFSSHLSPRCCCTVFFFFPPFLIYAITKAQLTSRIGSDLDSRGSLSEMSETGYAAAILGRWCWIVSVEGVVFLCHKLSHSLGVSPTSCHGIRSQPYMPDKLSSSKADRVVLSLFCCMACK